MTDKKSRRVVIINNIKSDTIDQAIFILKSNSRTNSDRINSSVAQEAQNIINSYIRQVELIKGSSPSRRKRGHNLLPAAISILSALCIGLSCVLFYYFG
ncbi:MAG: hypothetical protein IKW64_06395 [Clostridia bacterium]|nr:hypothetical protein [Clostridia bacterium]